MRILVYRDNHQVNINREDLEKWTAQGWSLDKPKKSKKKKEV